MATIQKITPCLWFDTQAEDAAKFYTSIFKNSTIGRINRYNKEGFEIHKRPAGSILTVEFFLDGQSFLALNGGPNFIFTEAISLMVICDTQEEIDYYWEKLSDGGDKNAQQCGWLKDKYGLSWQVAPGFVADLYADPNSRKSERAMKAMMQMKKLNIEALKQAFNG